MINADFIKKTVFETINFNYDGELEVFESDSLSVSYDGAVCKIGYASPVQLARGYFTLAKNIEKGSFEIKESPAFKTCGAMIDASRNAVITVDAAKKYMNYMACLGFNMLMLYTEDTYEVKEYPYFGYMRGRYNKEEIREIDDYGKSLGIEVVPCIQTLAHLEQFLKYSSTANIRDTKEILLVDEEETYKFIEAEIRAVREMYTTNRIHIGMDEAHDLGRGAYLDRFGHKDTFDILMKHLKRVIEICKKYDFEPMMWNDMFFRAFTSDKSYYRYDEVNFPEGYAKQIPDVDMVYWDYYSVDSKHYKGMIDKSKELGRKVIFAGGITTWNAFLPFGFASENCSSIALKACIENGVKEAFATMWGDDGTEGNVLYSIPYLPIYSEYCYRGADCAFDEIIETSEFLTKIPYELTQAMSKYTYRDENGVDVSGKPYFYSDVMYGTGIDNDKNEEAKAVYQDSLRVIDKYMKDGDINLKYAKLIYEILWTKADIASKLRCAYQNKDLDYIKECALKTLPKLKGKYIELKDIHKKQWYEVYKPFGFEVISFRYGGIISRLDDAIETLAAFLEGIIDNIPELEEKQLPTERQFNYVKQFVTPSYIF